MPVYVVEHSLVRTAVRVNLDMHVVYDVHVVPFGLLTFNPELAALGYV